MKRKKGRGAALQERVGFEGILSALIPNTQALLEGRDPHREKEQERRQRYLSTEKGRLANLLSTRKWSGMEKGREYNKRYIKVYLAIPEKRELYRAAWRRYGAKKQRARDKDQEAKILNRVRMKVYMREYRFRQKIKKIKGPRELAGLAGFSPLPLALSLLGVSKRIGRMRL